MNAFARGNDGNNLDGHPVDGDILEGGEEIEQKAECCQPRHMTERVRKNRERH